MAERTHGWESGPRMGERTPDGRADPRMAERDHGWQSGPPEEAPAPGMLGRAHL